MEKYFVSFEMMVVVCFFSLAWLVVGVLLGQRIPVVPNQGKKKRARGSDGSSCELYVGNLSYDVSENELRGIFKEFGRVASVRLIKNKFNDKSKGYGFVEMADRAAAEKAVSSLHNTDIKGRRIIVNEAKSSARD